MTLPKEGFSVTIIIDFQDNTLKLSKFNFVRDRIILSWWWAPSLVSAAVAVPATSSTLKVIDVISTTVPYFDVGGERTTVWPAETRFPCNLTICHLLGCPPLHQTGAFVLHLYLVGHEVAILVPAGPSNLYHAVSIVLSHCAETFL